MGSDDPSVAWTPPVGMLREICSQCEVEGCDALEKDKEDRVEAEFLDEEAEGEQVEEYNEQGEEEAGAEEDFGEDAENLAEEQGEEDELSRSRCACYGFRGMTHRPLAVSGLGLLNDYCRRTYKQNARRLEEGRFCIWV